MIQQLNSKEWLEAGGKANGLNRLNRMGLNVPSGLVVTYIDVDSEDRIKEALTLLPRGPKAVRSSADVEDSEFSSYAGQFKSFLNLKSQKEILDAIQDCKLSISDAKAIKYHLDRSGEEPIYMNVIVQQMIKAKWSGVIFSVNPILNRHDQLLIDIAKGSGLKLVGGEVEGTQIKLYKNDQIQPDGQEVLPYKLLQQLKDECLLAEKKIGYPVDMEFTIDEDHCLWWLQARPVTALDPIHINELDSPVDFPNNPIYTLGNVGEMMPGAITPLTWSVFGHAIEFGIQDMYKRCGVIDTFYERPRYLKLHYGRMFFDLHAMYDFPRNVLLAKKENIDISLTGKILTAQPNNKDAGKFKQLIGQIKNIRYNNSIEKKMSKFQDLERGFSIPVSENLNTMFKYLEEGKKQVFKSWSYHMCASSNSGALYTALLGVLSGDPLKTESIHHMLATQLIGDIEDIEGADMIYMMEDLLEMIRAESKKTELEFKDSSGDELLTYLKEDAPPSIRDLFKQLLKDHGHRGVREAALRSKDWSEDPRPFVQMMLNNLKLEGKKKHKKKDKRNYQKLLKDYSTVKSKIIQGLLPRVRRSIANREKTKSLGVKIQRKLKMAYIYFGQTLTKKNLLDDSDQVFFLQHHELGKLILDQSLSWKKIAEKRRKLFPIQMKMDFDHVLYSVPIPSEKTANVKLTDGVMQGTPVSLGKVQGRAFVAYSLEECVDIQQGDILIVEITDIGWTPYFGKIGGLVTEIGSPLSHGAVVAREYGLPAIVSVKNACQVFKTGDSVVLDANLGTISLA